MNRIAHLKVTCPQCGKYTSVYVVEDGASSAEVKCEHCRQIFTFGAGMMYEPVAYVSSIPSWAKISKADERKEKKNKRPTTITVICILGFIGAALSLLLVFSGSAVKIGNWYPPYAICLAIICFVSMLGLWKMKKWAVYTYTGIMVLNQIVLLAMGIWNFMVLIIPAIVAGIALANIKKMD